MDVEVRLLQSYSNFGLFYPGRVNKPIKQSCAQAVSQLSRRARGHSLRRTRLRLNAPTSTNCRLKILSPVRAGDSAAAPLVPDSPSFPWYKIRRSRQFSRTADTFLVTPFL
jgi:hypothetical protein